MHTEVEIDFEYSPEMLKKAEEDLNTLPEMFPDVDPETVKNVLRDIYENNIEVSLKHLINIYAHCLRSKTGPNMNQKSFDHVIGEMLDLLQDVLSNLTIAGFAAGRKLEAMQQEAAYKKVIAELKAKYHIYD